MTIIQTVEKVKLFCNYCHVSRFVTDEVLGEIVCSNCGFVISENTEYRGLDRVFLSNPSCNTRTGPGLTLKMHDQGLNTRIGIQNQDSVGKPLPAKTSLMFERLRKWDSRSQTKNSADKNLKWVLVEFDKIQSKLGLSDTVVERASLFYRKAIKRNLIRGRTVTSIAAACLYASCRDLEHNRSLTEIAIQFGIKRKEISRAYRILFEELGFAVTVANPIKSLSKIASTLELSEKTTRQAAQILAVAQNAGIIEGKNPEVIAASAIYAACVITGELKSQTKVAAAANTSTVSIRNRIQEFKTELGLFSTVN